MQLRREHELSRLRSDFISSVSHELRTPLSQILLFAETLNLGRVRTDDERRAATGVIVQEGRRLMHLVENILHFSRAERQMTRLGPEPIDLSHAVASDHRRLDAARRGGRRSRRDATSRPTFTRWPTATRCGRWCSTCSTTR